MSEQQQQVAMTKPAQPGMALKGYLEKQRGAISQVLPKGLTTDRIVKVMLVAAMKNPRIYECSQMSIVKSIVDAAQLGFELGSPLGHAYPVPYYNQKKKHYELQAIIGYKGYIKLAHGGDVVSIYACTAYEGERFEVYLGTRNEIIHEPRFDLENPQPIAFYAVAELQSGKKQFTVMTLEQVHRIRLRSQSPNSGPWSTDFEEMAKKTVTKRLCKYLNLSVESHEALAKADAIDNGEAAEETALTVASTAGKSPLAQKIEESAPEIDDEGFGDPPPPPPPPQPEGRVVDAEFDEPPPPPAPPPQVQQQRQESPPPTSAPAQAQAQTQAQSAPAPAAASQAASSPSASEEEVTAICKRIFGCANVAALAEVRGELEAMRQRVSFTKDQGARIRQTLTSKEKTLAAQQGTAAAAGQPSE